MNGIPKPDGSVTRRSLRRLGAVAAALVVLAFGSLILMAEGSRRSTAFALQVTATQVFQPGTTVTPIPGVPVPPSRAALYATRIVRILALAMLLFGILFFAFTRPGARNGKTISQSCIGFAAWFAVNTLLWIWVMQGESGTVILNPFRLLPLLVNIVALALLSISRRWIVLGIVCAILINAIALTLFPAPSRDVLGRDRTGARIFVMAPFYIPFFFPGI